MLAAPRLQVAMQSSFAVRALLSPGTTQRIRVRYVEVRSKKHLWLGSLRGGIVNDPFDAPSSVSQHGAEVALHHWIQWSGLPPN